MAFPLFYIVFHWRFFRCPFCFRRPHARNLVMIFARTKSLQILFSGAIGKGEKPLVAGPNASPYMVSKVVKLAIKLFELWGELRSSVYFVGTLPTCLAFGSSSPEFIPVVAPDRNSHHLNQYRANINRSNCRISCRFESYP